MLNEFSRITLVFLASVLWLSSLNPAAAHHVLGRPAYSLNEDSNTPPSTQGEVQIGDYLVTYMVFPAFPRPDTPGSISVYATRIDTGEPFPGDITFKARGDSWIPWLGVSQSEVALGVQQPDDNVFRQRYQFHEAGDYIVVANFQANGEPYIVEFPMRIGKTAPVGPAGIAIAAILIVILAVSIIQRRRALTGKIRASHARES